jgi:CheY-like chemotaxis protein
MPDIIVEPNTEEKNEIYNLNKKKILIVDDDVTSYKYLNKLLEHNYNVLYAENGQQAIDIVRMTPEIDLVLMDIRMPVIDGLLATVQIKKIHPNLPVIAQTAYAFSEEKSIVFSYGCDDLITKPTGRNDLLKLIDKYISKNE